ncbi:MAG: glycosyltransferase family 4 protein [Sulfuricurvum sp.]|uniref:glycosyltransferase family 4 protein n=1 Tax=Sulfuricurvum sp. TaxID=2025608 RepID=UPI002602607F|nr:glycosyltransferase family 4 protein [Sulfuricurvum sp.]MDD2367840.1 glycosyltransferase family 4 protein [Sulfuricurvum sp.]MDD5117210.1 glycosyltransferase family 4 protein [Sulfuricurvum sp.]
MVKITHLTSAHPRYDTRIFVKMCCSLARIEGYNVSLIVADGKGDEIKNGVSIIDIGIDKSGRIARMTKTVQNVYRQALHLDSDIYHLHDPELLTIALKLKKQGKKVIFDSHEDYPKQLLNKPYLSPFAAKTLSFVFTHYQKYICSRIDALVTATPYIRDQLLTVNSNTVDINNFPIIEEFAHPIAWNFKKNEVVYLGAIAAVRGIKEMTLAMGLVKNARLNLGGIVHEDDTYKEVQSYDGWKNVNELGFLNRNEVAQILSNSKAGLVTLHPTSNYPDALPVKMFEYMIAGIPVIASNFPLWQEIVEGNQCGICVNPLDPKAIVEAINWIIDHPIEAEAMGENGINAVKNLYNWGKEEKKLFALYSNLSRNLK